MRTDREVLVYGPILPDYEYLRDNEQYDREIEGSEVVAERDDVFKETHMEFLTRFFDVIDSMVRYVTELQQFFVDLGDGLYINMDIAKLMLHPEGKQLMCEVVYLWGVMLLLMDFHIPGVIRERLIVSYYRYEGQARVMDLERAFRLCRRTGIVERLNGALRPSALTSEPILPLVQRASVVGYPEELFARFPLDDHVVGMVVEHLRTDDIYHLRAHFPHPAHRSVALATQAAMVYVILWFAPDVLRHEKAAMREIVDKHFPDSWVMSYHCGYVVDLSVMWAPYPAASEALANTLEPAHVQRIAKVHAKEAVELVDHIGSLLKEGVITPGYVLDNIDDLLSVVRDANVVLRWFLLHRLAIRKSHLEVVYQSLADQRGPLSAVLRKHAIRALSAKRSAEAALQEKKDAGKKGKRRGSKKSKKKMDGGGGGTGRADFVFVGLDIDVEGGGGDAQVSASREVANTTSAEGAVAVAGTRVGSLAQQLLLHLLLLTAQLEFSVRSHIDELVKAREESWGKLRDRASVYMQELSEFFAGTAVFKRSIEVNDELAAWFRTISDEIGKLEVTKDGDDGTVSSSAQGQRIQEVIRALNENLEHHQVAPSLQVKSYIKETQDVLMRMVRTLNTTESILDTMSIVSELGFAWKTLDDIVPVMQYQIERNPKVILQFRALALKLQSVLEMSLIRIIQCGSHDRDSVLEYYSGRLVDFIQGVIAVIPRAVFVKLREIITLQADGMQAVPLRVDKDKLKAVAQLQQRYRLAEVTHSVSVYARGVLEMGQTLVGVIQIDPEQLLIDGIRAELVKQVATALHDARTDQYRNLKSMHDTIGMIGRKLDGIRTGFEYIQDYVNVNGLRIWNEEFNRILFHYVEQECSLFLSVRTQQSVYQSREIPIPTFRSFLLKDSVSFMGCFVNALVSFTSPLSSVYVERMMTWYHKETEEVVFNRQMLIQLRKSFQIAGLVGIDRMFAFRILRALKRFFHALRLEISPGEVSSALSLRRQQQLQEERARAAVSRQEYASAGRYPDGTGDVLEAHGPILATAEE